MVAEALKEKVMNYCTLLDDGYDYKAMRRTQ